jgi:hypothetical protein
MERLLSDPTQNHYAEYSDAADGIAAPVIDMHQVIKSGNAPSGVSGSKLKSTVLEVSKWLPFAAEAYNISPKMDDFVLVPTLIFMTDIPNANLCAFPFGEMSRWNPNAGELSYLTWRKKPTFEEHSNSDHTKAKGVIFDASMKRAPEFVGQPWRVILLNAWDRNRDAALASRISAGRHGFSMGSYVQTYRCSITGCGGDLRKGGCEHIHPDTGPRMKSVGKELVYRVAMGVQGFECSAVKNPAYRNAWGEPIG